MIELYETIKADPAGLLAALYVHQDQHDSQYYYEIRSRACSSKLERAARTLYLNRTCWNGLYRLNKNGEFNVPIGTKNSVVLPSDDFEAISSLLNQADIRCCDFEDTIEEAQIGDLLFVDPPYTVAHNQNGFVKYNEKIFSWADQIRLRDALERASQRGASIIMSNANHESLSELYADFGRHEEVARRSVISSLSKGRGSVTELLVRL